MCWKVCCRIQNNHSLFFECLWRIMQHLILIVRKVTNYYGEFGMLHIRRGCKLIKVESKNTNWDDVALLSCTIGRVVFIKDKKCSNSYIYDFNPFKKKSLMERLGLSHIQQFLILRKGCVPRNHCIKQK